MIATPSTDVDADELLHLAVLDSQKGNHEDAISKLKRSLALNPEDANATFMLAAEHAELGMVDRSIEEMIEAIRLDPKLAIAHFQLGLLYVLYQNDAVTARKAWASLDTLPGAEALVLFKTGLLHLADGAFGKALADLDLGLKQNNSNPSLNREMAKIRHRVSEMAAAQRETRHDDTESSAANQILLSSYEKPPGTDSH